MTLKFGDVDCLKTARQAARKAEARSKREREFPDRSINALAEIIDDAIADDHRVSRRTLADLITDWIEEHYMEAEK